MSLRGDLSTKQSRCDDKYEIATHHSELSALPSVVRNDSSLVFVVFIVLSGVPT